VFFLFRAYWYVNNRQIHDDLCVQLFSDHIRALTESFDSKIADVEIPLVQQLGRYLSWPRVDPIEWRKSEGREGKAGQSRPSPAMTKSTKRISFSAEQLSALRLPWLRVFVILLSCMANARVFDEKLGHGLHSPPPGAAALPKGLNRRISAVCDTASLASKPRQPTNQS